jgi:hypothetical protein
MDILLEGVGMIIFLALLFGLLMYTVRHRGRLIKWMENLNATPNAEEKQTLIKKLTREREDIDAELATLTANPEE